MEIYGQYGRRFLEIDTAELDARAAKLRADYAEFLRNPEFTVKNLCYMDRSGRFY